MSSPFNSKSPEAYLAGLRRKDSKNALTTCHGVTDKGRACRRALASPKNSSRFDGAVVITNNAEDPAVFFCWQHKDQAENVVEAEEGSVVSLKGRHSLEDAFRSLGLEDVDEEPEQASKSPSPQPLSTPQTHIPEPLNTFATDFAYRASAQGNSLEKKRHSYERPRHSRRESGKQGTTREKPIRRRSEDSRPHNQKGTFSLLSCCFGAEPSQSKRDRLQYTRDQDPPIRRVENMKIPPEPKQYTWKNTSKDARLNELSKASPHNRRTISPAGRHGSPRTPAEVRRKDLPSHRKSDSGFAMNPTPDIVKNGRSIHRLSLNIYRDTSPTPAPRQAYNRNPNSDSHLHAPETRPLKGRSQSTPDQQQLQRLHAEWPPPLPRSATDTTRIIYAKLLTAMSEPPSKSDTPGYIYIFWQTEVQQTDDETSAVASIISAPTLDRSAGLQRQETILQRRFFQTSANARLPQKVDGEGQQRTLFLKIGRAVNVYQRLNQWRKQCEYDISLLRSYPYEAGKRKAAIEARPVPNVVKVERLIHLHLEMLGQRVSRACRCGTEHKEWFEVQGTARGVREVDEIVRRWVRWSEERFGPAA